MTRRVRGNRKEGLKGWKRRKRRRRGSGDGNPSLVFTMSNIRVPGDNVFENMC